MNMQRPPRKSPEELSRFVDEVDRAAGDLPRNLDVQPPTYGGPQRDAINSVVDGIVGDICTKISELQRSLKTIEDQVLQSAAKSKHSLNEHVVLCVKLNDEIRHAQDVINELKIAAEET
jgi:hypothetical protein